MRRACLLATVVVVVLVVGAAAPCAAAAAAAAEVGGAKSSHSNNNLSSLWRWPSFLPSFSLIPRAGARLPTVEDLFGAPEPAAPSVPNSYRGTYGHVTCRSDVLVRPSDTAELASAVKSLVARAAAEGRPLKIRPARDGFASMPSFPCAAAPEGRPGAYGVGAGSPAPLVAALLLNKMDKVLGVDKEKLQMRVQGQITLRDFYAAATAAGMSIPRGSLPWWQGLTMAGIMATTSHGSGLNTTSMICDWVESVTWVDGLGRVRESAAGSDEARALCGGVGVVGAIAELTLQMTPLSNTRISTWFVKDDADLVADIDRMLGLTPHLVLMWRPDIGKYTGHMQSPAPEGAPVIADAQSSVIPQFTPLAARAYGPALRAWQGDPFNQEVSYSLYGDAPTCAAARMSAVGAPWATRPAVDDLHTPPPILEGVAPTNQITSTECGDRCAWISKDMQATALDVEFAFEKARLAAVVGDIRRLVALDLKSSVPGWHAAGRCLSPGYYVFRFGKAAAGVSDVGMASGLQQPVYVQQQMLVSRNTPGIPSRYEWVQEAYEQMMLCRHDGRPHWGKNWDRTFTNPRCPVAAKNPRGFAALRAAQDASDPLRVFEPELWRRMVAGESYALKPRCQLDRTCYCSADEHCADGFACRPSAAFPEFLTCQPKVIN